MNNNKHNQSFESEPFNLQELLQEVSSTDLHSQITDHESITENNRGMYILARIETLKLQKELINRQLVNSEVALKIHKAMEEDRQLVKLENIAENMGLTFGEFVDAAIRYRDTQTSNPKKEEYRSNRGRFKTQYPEEIKNAAMQSMLKGIPLLQIEKDLNVCYNTLSQWKGKIGLSRRREGSQQLQIA